MAAFVCHLLTYSKDDQPYDEKKLEDESAWSPLYEIATAKMKEEAEEWKGLMDVSLVFVSRVSQFQAAVHRIRPDRNLFSSTHCIPGTRGPKSLSKLK